MRFSGLTPFIRHFINKKHQQENIINHAQQPTPTYKYIFADAEEILLLYII